MVSSRYRQGRHFSKILRRTFSSTKEIWAICSIAEARIQTTARSTAQVDAVDQVSHVEDHSTEIQVRDHNPHSLKIWDTEQEIKWVPRQLISRRDRFTQNWLTTHKQEITTLSFQSTCPSLRTNLRSNSAFVAPRKLRLEITLCILWLAQTHLEDLKLLEDIKNSIFWEIDWLPDTLGSMCHPFHQSEVQGIRTLTSLKPGASISICFGSSFADAHICCNLKNSSCLCDQRWMWKEDLLIFRSLVHRSCLRKSLRFTVSWVTSVTASSLPSTLQLISSVLNVSAIWSFFYPSRIKFWKWKKTLIPVGAVTRNWTTSSLIMKRIACKTTCSASITKTKGVCKALFKHQMPQVWIYLNPSQVRLIPSSIFFSRMKTKDIWSKSLKTYLKIWRTHTKFWRDSSIGK